MNLSNLIYVPGRGYFEKLPNGKADYSRPRNEAAWASPEEQARDAELKAFLESQYYNPNKSYQDQYASLFGNKNMYQGPQGHWIGALDSRMNERLQGNYGTGSQYEFVARNTNRDNQRQMYARNNIIEDMYRNGYSKHQISQHINGLANIADMTPDWADYDERMSGYYRGGPANNTPFKAPVASGGVNDLVSGGGLFSGENQSMRDFIKQRLESSLFGKGMFGG